MNRFQRLRRAWAESASEHNSYSDELIDQIRRNLSGDPPAGPSAAEETAAGLLSSALATANVTGSHDYLLSTAILQTIGRELVLNGESLWLFEGNELRWQQSYSAGAKPTNLIQIVRAMNWQSGRGRSAMSCAATACRMVRQIEAALETETRIKSIYVTPVPQSGTVRGGESALRTLWNRLFTLKTPQALVEGEMQSGISNYQPTGNYQQRRMGVEPPNSALTLLEAADRRAFLAMGIPRGLVGQAVGTELREAWRQYLSTVVVASAKTIREAFLMAGLNIRLEFPALVQSDITNRARAFKQLVDSGMGIDKALAVSGLMLGDGDDGRERELTVVGTFREEA